MSIRIFYSSAKIETGDNFTNMSNISNLMSFVSLNLTFKIQWLTKVFEHFYFRKLNNYEMDNKI